jgi:hypothetical protein
MYKYIHKYIYTYIHVATCFILTHLYMSKEFEFEFAERNNLLGIFTMLNIQGYVS